MALAKKKVSPHICIPPRSMVKKANKHDKHYSPSDTGSGPNVGKTIAN
jgi:hypothetical protein